MTAAASLKARYCSSRANSRSRASSSGDVLGVDELALRQQPGDLQVEQGGRDDEELGRLVELLLVVDAAQVGDELVGDRAESDTSVMSSSCLAISESSRSNGPSKLVSVTRKPARVPRPVSSASGYRPRRRRPSSRRRPCGRTQATRATEATSSRASCR